MQAMAVVFAYEYDQGRRLWSVQSYQIVFVTPNRKYLVAQYYRP